MKHFLYWRDRGRRYLKALLHYNVALDDGCMLLRLRHHILHRANQHAVPVGDVACRRIARAASGGDPWSY